MPLTPPRIPALTFAAALLACIGTSGAVAQNLSNGLGGFPTPLCNPFPPPSPKQNTMTDLIIDYVSASTHKTTTLSLDTHTEPRVPM